MLSKKEILAKLREIPGVGKEIAEDFLSIGIRKPSDLKNKNPEQLYDALCKKQGMKIDRCMLYVFRCAVYFASHTKHNPKLLKWWKWKDKSKKSGKI